MSDPIAAPAAPETAPAQAASAPTVVGSAQALEADIGEVKVALTGDVEKASGLLKTWGVPLGAFVIGALLGHVL